MSSAIFSSRTLMVLALSLTLLTNTGCLGGPSKGQKVASVESEAAWWNPVCWFGSRCKKDITVFVADKGAALAGANVKIDRKTVATNEAGESIFTKVRTGNKTITVSANHFKNASRRVKLGKNGLTGENRVVVDLERTTHAVEVEVSAGDQRLENAKVTMIPNLAGYGEAVATTDGGGIARFDGVPEQDGQTLFRVEREGYNTVESGTTVSSALTGGSKLTIALTSSWSGRRGMVRANGSMIQDDDGPFNALGITMFSALYWLKNDRARLERSLKDIAANGFHYFRALGVVGWDGREIDYRWPDYDERIAELTDLAYDKYGVRVQWTLIGDGQETVPTIQERYQLIDKFLAMSRGREHKIIMFEIANEPFKNGFSGDSSQLRTLARYMKDRTDNLVAGGSQFASDESDDCSGIYASNGGATDVGILHIEREIGTAEGPWRPVRKPWEYRSCPQVPLIGSNNEPIGPGSSVNSEKDPMRLVSAMAVTYVSRMSFYVFHTRPGVGIGGVRDGISESEDFINVPGMKDFQVLQKHIPNDLTTWTPHNGHWASNPFIMFADGVANAIWPEGYSNGLIRNYASVKGNAFVAYPIGIKNYVDLEARRAMMFDVIHPLTGQIVQQVTLNAGQRFRLQGAEAFLLKGILL